MRVLFTPSARTEFLAALEHLRERNPDAALRLRQRAKTVLHRLERFPLSGRGIPEFPDLPYREVIVPPDRFFYRVVEKTVWIVAVWHSAQVPSEPEMECGV